MSGGALCYKTTKKWCGMCSQAPPMDGDTPEIYLTVPFHSPKIVTFVHQPMFPNIRFLWKISILNLIFVTLCRSESYSPCSSSTVDESLSSLMDQDLILEWWEEIWQRKTYDNTFLSEFDPLPYSYEDTNFIGKLLLLGYCSLYS